MLSIKLLYPIATMVLSRIHGSGQVTLSKVTKGILFALPMAIYTIYSLSYTLPVTIALSCLILALGATAKNTGHRDGFIDQVYDNFLSGILKYAIPTLKVRRNSKTYDAIFWVLKGLCLSVPISILTGNYFILLFTTIGYPIGYLGSFKYFRYVVVKNKFMSIISDTPVGVKVVYTVWAELFVGFMTGLGMVF